jgi:septal ring factor EnvC (AmiA/AmiB activator)
METLVSMIQHCEVTTIAVLILCFYLYDKRMEKRFEKIDQRFDKVDQRFEKIDQRFDKLDEQVKDIDRRLCRLEGAFSSKDFCMIKDERNLRKTSE